MTYTNTWDEPTEENPAQLAGFNFMYNEGMDVKIMISNEGSWTAISSRATEMKDLSPELGGRVAVRDGDVWNVILMNFEDDERTILL